MRFVPDYFFCILSTFVRFLCPEENGSLFRAKSIFIQRVYSSLPAVRGGSADAECFDFGG